MARYTGPVCRMCRREGMKLFFKGARCYTKKCAFERRPSPPGQHGIRRRKVSEFGIQLREKQKMRRVYGVLERQFKNYFAQAESRPGVTGENLLRLLETRVDNTVYRMGFASSRSQGRQMVLHGHFQVNGRAVNVPSYQVQPDDVVEVRESRRKRTPYGARSTFRTARSRPPRWENLPSNWRNWPGFRCPPRRASWWRSSNASDATNLFRARN